LTRVSNLFARSRIHVLSGSSTVLSAAAHIFAEFQRRFSIRSKYCVACFLSPDTSAWIACTSARWRTSDCRLNQLPVVTNAPSPATPIKTGRRGSIHREPAGGCALAGFGGRVSGGLSMDGQTYLIG